jgi:hypothetical protein
MAPVTSMLDKNHSPWVPPRIEDAAFRYLRILREELKEFSFLYVRKSGWIPPLSKLNNLLHILSKQNEAWSDAAALADRIYQENPKDWDDIRSSKNLDKLIDLFRDYHARKWLV